MFMIFCPILTIITFTQVVKGICQKKTTILKTTLPRAAMLDLSSIILMLNGNL